jgi:hypothetical protein
LVASLFASAALGVTRLTLAAVGFVAAKAPVVRDYEPERAAG